tara:strand:+ start:1059 stop:1745 length:687 start_codon:yes stop_codon:yes gene_type:complete
MIGHCLKRTQMCKDLSETYVATCDSEIYDFVLSIGGKSIMTSDAHERATDRSAEAISKIEKETGTEVDIVVMIQGDEPMVTPEMISESLSPFFLDEEVNVVNLMAKIDTVEEFEDPNEVKVVVDNNNFALYFSREPIPSRKKGIEKVQMLKQVCIIPFKKKYLTKFNSMRETPLEVIESVDMMRILEHGEKVKMVMTNKMSYSVDTEEDRLKVEKAMKGDSLLKQYIT